MKVKKALPQFDDFTLTIVGLKYRLSDREISQLQEIVEEEGGLPCTFEQEPENEVDAKAVKVVALDPENKVFNGRHLGYVRRPTNQHLSELLKRGAAVKLCLLDYVDEQRGEGELEVRIARLNNKTPAKSHI